MDISGAFAAFSASYGLLAIFIVMLVKEIGVPVPVPSDLLMVGAGLQIAAGLYSPVELALALAVAVFVGGSVQFLLARTAGRAIVYRLAAAVGIGADRLDGAVARLGAGGARAVFLGLNIPGARAAVIPAAGLARVAFVPFIAAALAGSLVFYGWHVALGYLAGPTALTLAERYSLAALAALLALGGIGLVVWLFVRRRRAALRSWTEAACPACLAITALRASSRDVTA